MLMRAPHPSDILQIRKLIVFPEEWDGNIWGDPDDSEPGEDDYFPQISLNMKLDPSLKWNSLKDLGVVLCDILCESLRGIHYSWQIYRKNTAESQVKLKQSIKSYFYRFFKVPKSLVRDSCLFLSGS